MTGQTQTASSELFILVKNNLVRSLCVRLPRLFALITGWMAEPLLAWCFFCFLLEWPLIDDPFVVHAKQWPNLIRRIMWRRQAASQFRSCLSKYFIEWSLVCSSSVFIFARMRALANKHPREWFILFYDSFPEPKPIRFGIDKPPSQQ